MQSLKYPEADRDDEPARDEIEQGEDFVHEMKIDYKAESVKLGDEGIPVFSFRVPWPCMSLFASGLSQELSPSKYVVTPD